MTRSAPEIADGEPRQGRTPRPSLALAAALAVVAAAYANALHGPFVWDDTILIVEPGVAHRLNPLAHLSEAFWHRSATQLGSAVYYRPVTTFTYAVDWALWGGRPAGFHVTNVLLHLVVVALVFALARRAGASAVSAALAAAAFGVFPRLTESVTWISGRTDVLAAGFAIAALLVHIDSRSMARRCAASALLVLGMLAKEVAASALVAIVAVELAAMLRKEKAARDALAAVAPAFVGATGYAALRVHALADVPAATFSDFENRFLLSLHAIGQYFVMLVDPRPRLQIGLLGLEEPALIILGAAVSFVLVILAVSAARRPPRAWILALFACAATAVALVIHVVPLQVITVAADRFLYVPVACLAVALALASERLGARSSRAAALLGAALVLGYAVTTAARNEDYADEIRLWQVAVDTSLPQNPIPAHELGNALSRARRHEEAVAAFRRALPFATGENKVSALANIATSLSELGRLEEARAALAQVVAIDPSRPVNHLNLGVVEMRLLRFAVAEAEIEIALRLLPEYDEARRALEIARQLRTVSAELPPESPGEPLEVRVRRARFWTVLGVRHRAAPLWEALASSPDAEPAQLEQAAAYLASFGDRPAAERALASAREVGVEPAKLEAIAVLLNERFREKGAP